MGLAALASGVSGTVLGGRTGAAQELAQPDQLARAGCGVAVDDWRRTTRGWERRGSWEVAALPATGGQSAATLIHPLVFAVLQFVGSVAALRVFDSGSSPAGSKKPENSSLRCTKPAPQCH